MKKLMTMLISLLALCACSNDLDNPDPNPSPAPDPVPPVERKDIPLTETEKLIVSKNNDFSYRLFKQVNDSCPKPSNLLISPLSLNYALSMLNNGAGGETQKEIMNVLGYDGFTENEVNGFNRKMLNVSSRLDSRVSLVTANSIWLSEGLPVLSEFKELNKLAYLAETFNVDFASPQTLQKINAWASHYTDGRIPTILEKINPGVAFYLLNALSFKGMWATPFDKKATQTELFTNADGSTAQVPMMNRTFNTVCMAGNNFNMLMLPYGNSAFSFYILLPVKGETPASVVAGLSEKNWAKMFQNRTGYNVHLKLPRFSMTTQTDFKYILSALGMPSAFDGSKADFSRLSPLPLCLSETYQKAGIELDEEGTKAETVTVIEGMVTSPGPMHFPELDFFVDRPFVYMIRENSTGAIFFMGEMNHF